MDLNAISPYVRLAWTCGCYAPFIIDKRIIFDYELIYMEKGKWELEINDQKLICNQGDFIFIRPGVNHTMRSIDDIDVQQPHIHFDFIYTKKSKDRYICFTTEDELSQKEKELITEDVFEEKNLPVVFTPKDSEIWKSLMYELIELDKRKTPYNQAIMKEKMLSLCHLLLVEFGEIATYEKTTFSNVMLGVREYIDNYHLYSHSKRLTLDTLSEHFHLDKYYIDKTFKKMFGMPVIKYYNQKTISYAKIYLMQNKSIQEVSDMFTFSSVYVFSRFFKQNTGISPSSFKKTLKTIQST